VARHDHNRQLDDMPHVPADSRIRRRFLVLINGSRIAPLSERVIPPERSPTPPATLRAVSRCHLRWRAGNGIMEHITYGQTRLF